MEALQLFHIQPGDWVTISEPDGVSGGFGEVLRMDDKRIVDVKWMKGPGKHAAGDLQKLEIQKYDRVRLTSSADNVKDGGIGVVLSLSQACADTEWCTAVEVQFPHKDGPSQVACMSLPLDGLEKGMDLEGVGEMKATFKKYDQNLAKPRLGHVFVTDP